MRVKFYDVDIGSCFVLLEQDGVLVKTDHDTAERASTSEAVLVNPDDYVILLANS